MRRNSLILLIFCLIIILNCNGKLTITPVNELNLRDFEITWNIVNDVYPYVDHKNVNWDSLYYIYESRLQSSNRQKSLKILAEMLSELKDQHVYLETRYGQVFQPYFSERTMKDFPYFSLDVVKKYINGSLHKLENDKVYYGKLKDNIGYVYFESFKSPYLLKDFRVVQEFMEDTKALIIDIRNNFGGLCTNVYKIIGWFLESPIEHPDFYVLGTRKATPPIPPNFQYYYSNPVVVLVNGVCYSSSDLFTEIMKQIPNVTVVGDTTGGGSSGSIASAPGDFILPSGVILHVSTVDFRGYNGLPWEDIGISPDIRIEQIMDGTRLKRDQQLIFATDYLGKQKISSQSNYYDNEESKYNIFLNIPH